MEKNNIFYITTNNKGTRTVIYSGLFLPSDSKEAVSIFDSNQDSLQNQIDAGQVFLEDTQRVETAIVTRRQIRVNK